MALLFIVLGAACVAFLGGVGGGAVGGKAIQQGDYQCGFGTLDLNCKDRPAKRVAVSKKRIPQPQSGTNYYSVAWQDAIEEGIDPNVFTKQINQESGFNPGAYSPAGAIGISQLMPSTAKGLGVNAYDPLASLKAAAKIDRANINTYGNYSMMLAAYNAGNGTLNYCLGTSDWFNCLPLETRNYIRVILG